VHEPNRYAISAKMGVFDFQTALIQIVTGLALVGVATIITDLMGEYVIPDVKAAYRKAKYPLPANLRGTQGHSRDLQGYSRV
jgi:hypothetical protein